MKQQLQAEARVLDRVMYLLEEGSVAYLMQTDESFARYVADLYAGLGTQSASLRNTSTT